MGDSFWILHTSHIPTRILHSTPLYHSVFPYTWSRTLDHGQSCFYHYKIIIVLSFLNLLFLYFPMIFSTIWYENPNLTWKTKMFRMFLSPNDLGQVFEQIEWLIPHFKSHTSTNSLSSWITGPCIACSTTPERSSVWLIYISMYTQEDLFLSNY